MMMQSELATTTGTVKRAGCPPENPKMVSVAGLMARGWTTTMIAPLLGEPEKYAPNPHYRNAPVMRLYSFERVKTLEASAEFAAIKGRLEKRAAIAKTAKVLDLTTKNILAAIWAVNQGAARRRVAAETDHLPGYRRFALSHDRKKRLYDDLKDWGIAYLAVRGELTASNCHNGITVWSGHGYSFHSTLAPIDLAPGDNHSTMWQEAKLAKVSRMRIIDAQLILERLDDQRGAFRRLE